MHKNFLERAFFEGELFRGKIEYWFIYRDEKHI